MPSESARMSSGAEARFRIDAPNSVPRRIKVIALDRVSEAVVTSLARRPWNNARFLTASAFAAAPPEAGAGVPGLLADVAGKALDLIDEVASADLVVMVAAPGENAGAAALIGEACSLNGVATTGLILGRRFPGRRSAADDGMVSAALAQLRPWALMLVIAEGDDYVEDMLRALRA
jgi:hypothetical protein